MFTKYSSLFKLRLNGKIIAKMKRIISFFVFLMLLNELKAQNQPEIIYFGDVKFSCARIDSIESNSMKHIVSNSSKSSEENSFLSEYNCISVSNNTFARNFSNSSVNFLKVEIEYENFTSVDRENVSNSVGKNFPNFDGKNVSSFDAKNVPNFDLESASNLVAKNVPNPSVQNIPSFNRQNIPSLDAQRIIKFDASYNNLVKIPNSLFKSMRNIYQIAFSSNRLQKLESHDFDSDAKFITILLENNSISAIENGTFSEQTQLQYLNLQNNQIKSIDKNIFVKNVNLRTLILNENPLKNLSLNVLPVQIKKILKCIPTDSIETLNLNCERPFCSFDANEQGFTQNNRFENVSHFYSSGIDFNFWDLTAKFSKVLKIFHVSNSFIGTLNRRFFEKFTELTEISLRNTNITIDPNTFLNQTKLIRLDLSFNHLNDVDQLFESQKFVNLTNLNVAGNRLVTIDTITPHHFPRLLCLGIQNNSFSDDYLKTFLQNWEGYGLQLSGDSLEW